MAYYLVKLPQESNKQYSKPKILHFSESSDFILTSLLFVDTDLNVKTILINKKTRQPIFLPYHSQFMSLVEQNEQLFIFKINNNLRNFQIDCFRVDFKSKGIELLNSFHDFELDFRGKVILNTKFKGNMFLVSFYLGSNDQKKYGFKAYKLGFRRIKKCLDVTIDNQRFRNLEFDNCYRVLLIQKTYPDFNFCGQKNKKNLRIFPASFFIYKKFHETLLFVKALSSNSIKVIHKWADVFSVFVDFPNLYYTTMAKSFLLNLVNLKTMKFQSKFDLSKLQIDSQNALLMEMHSSSEHLVIYNPSHFLCFLFSRDLSSFQTIKFPSYLPNCILKNQYQVHFEGRHKELKIIDLAKFYDVGGLLLAKRSNKSRLANLLDFEQRLLFRIRDIEKISSKICQVRLSDHKLDFLLNVVGLKPFEIEFLCSQIFKTRSIKVSRHSIKTPDDKYPFMLLRVDLADFNVRSNEFLSPEIPSFCKIHSYYGWDYFLFLACNRPMDHSLYLSSHATSLYQSQLMYKGDREALYESGLQATKSADVNLYQVYVFKPEYSKTVAGYLMNSSKSFELRKDIRPEVLAGTFSTAVTQRIQACFVDQSARQLGRRYRFLRLLDAGVYLRHRPGLFHGPLL